MAEQTPIPFVKLAFAGKRFSGSRLPADASANIAIYQRILIEIAKQIWREKNLNRLQLPRNFEKYFQLQLGEISEGSAVVSLPRYEEDLPPLFGAMAPGDIFDKAQNQLVEIVDAANENRALPQLSQSVRRELRNLRRDLRSSENLIITRGRLSRSEDRHTFTEATRERINREIREERLEYISGFGMLSGVSENPPEIQLNSEHGSFSIKVNFETARQTYNGQNGRLVDFNIGAIVDYDGFIKKVESVNSFNLVEDSESMHRASERCQSLAGLEAGWFDGDGDALNQLTIITARDVARFISSIVDDAGIFPTVDGEISIEYSRNELEWSVIIRDQHIIAEVLNLDDNESIVSRFRGVSTSLLRFLLSERGYIGD